MNKSFGKIRKDPRLLITASIITLLLILFILYPLYSAFKMSITGDGGISFSVYREVFTQKQNIRAISNSLVLATLTATFSTFIGFTFAYSIHRAIIPGQKYFRAMAILPLISPPFMFALSHILLFGRNGLITARLLGIDSLGIYGLNGLVVVQTMGMFPLSYLILSGIVRAVDPDLELSAMNLGARRLRVFRTITLPLTLPGLLASWLMVFMGSLTDFGNPIIIGGDFNVLSVQAYLEFTGMGNLPRGTALAILLLLPTLFIFTLQKQILKRRSYVSASGKSVRNSRGLGTPGISRALFIFCLMITVFILLIYITIIAGSFITLWGEDWSFTLKHLSYSYDVGFKTLINTLLLALISTPITAAMGILIAFLATNKDLPGRKILEFLSLLSYAIPGTVVGIGYVLAFNRSPFKLSGTAFILIAVYVFRNLPITVEGGIAALSQVSGEIEESAANLGGNSAYILRRVTLPMIRPAFFAGATYAFIRSMTAISAIIFLISARWNHMSVLILAQTEIMRLGVASVMSFVLIILISIIIFLGSQMTKLKGTGLPASLKQLKAY
ncbi:MAG: ABC transporter permease [Spirochaetaceae bacterium 4572_59]|nr:MAG: ABC transporter permease [Spirochaetaceae bacterium 4572_59]